MNTARMSKSLSCECSCASSCRTDSSNAGNTSSKEWRHTFEGKNFDPENLIATEDEKSIAHDEATYPRVEDVHDTHSRFAPLLKIDRNPPIIRKYESLHTRVMLFREYELHNLEQELSALDAATDNGNGLALDRKLREERSWGGRTDLINRIDDKLRDYHDAVQRAQSFSALPKPTQLHSPGDAGDRYKLLAQLEATISYEDGDFISIVDRHGVWIDRRLQMAWKTFTECMPAQSSFPVGHIEFFLRLAPYALGTAPLFESVIVCWSIGVPFLLSLFTLLLLDRFQPDRIRPMNM